MCRLSAVVGIIVVLVVVVISSLVLCYFFISAKEVMVSPVSVCLLTQKLLIISMKFYKMIRHDPGTNWLDFE